MTLKFKEGDSVVLKLNKEQLLGDSKTRNYCGLCEGQMPLATDGGDMVVMHAIQADHGKGLYNSYHLSHPLFGEYEYWWFHEDDLEFATVTLENE